MTELTPLSMVQEASAVTQADIDKLKDELSGMNSEKAQLEKELKSIQNNKNTALAQKENIDKQINLLQSEIRNVESLISEYETLIEQTEQEIRENEEEEKRQYEKFCARVRSMEERGTVSYWSVLFNAASFTDLLSAMDFISEIMDSDQKVIDDLRALREQIEQKKASLEASLAEQQTAKETLVTKKNELNTQRAAAEKVLADLKANEAQYKQVLSEKDAAMERQQAEIVRLSRELAAKNGDTTATLGGYIWPCSSRYVTSPLGARYTGIAGASTNHAGIDIGGTNLKAGLTDENGRLLAVKSMKIREVSDPDVLADTLVTLTEELAAQGGIAVQDIASVGAGIPGVVDIRTGSIVYTCNLPLRDVPLRKLFHKYLNIPLYIENDANCAALAEFQRRDRRFGGVK